MKERVGNFQRCPRIPGVAEDLLKFGFGDCFRRNPSRKQYFEAGPGGGFPVWEGGGV